MVKHYNIKVTGKVQGVFYRDSTKKTALELGVTGFVRNMPDGSVYIEAEADEDKLKQLVEWCRLGPKRAEVTSVTATEGEVVGFSQFEIRH